jgi:streptomycin 6-kinase
MTYSLNHYQTLWTLSAPQLLAETATSHVYTVTTPDGPAVLKLLSALGVKDEKAGAVALKYFNGNGAVRLLQADDGAHLLEYAAGEDLKARVQQGRDEEAAGIIGDTLNLLHAQTTPPPTGLVPLQRWFRALFDYAQEDIARDGSGGVYRRAAVVAENLLANPRDERVLHGDIHHENIRHSSRGFLALDPKGLYGERTYDAANTLLNPWGLDILTESEARFLKVANILAQKTGIALPRLLEFTQAYAALSACWTLEDGGDPRHALTISALAERHRAA